MKSLFPLALSVALAAPLIAQRHAREGEQVLQDRESMLESDLWIYNDVDRGIAESRKTGKPILLVFR